MDVKGCEMKRNVFFLELIISFFARKKAIINSDSNNHSKCLFSLRCCQYCVVNMKIKLLY